MTGRSHLCFGIITGSATAACLYGDNNIGMGIGVLSSVILGSLFPDIDNRKSLISKKMKILSVITNKLFGHRGFLHSPVFILLITLLSLNCLPERYHFIAWGYTVGLAGHLFLDMLTAGGVPLLYPFYKKRFRIIRARTGGRAELFILIISCVFSAALIIILSEFSHGLF